MRSILMSIRPEWCDLIFSGDKVIELRKTRPKDIVTPFKVFVYETMARLEEPWMDEDGHMILRGSGMVVGEFVCYSVVRIDADSVGLIDCDTKTYMDFFPDLPDFPMHNTCVDRMEFMEYTGGKKVYGWEIEGAERYKTQIDLSAFNVRRPPQSWCYVEVQP